MQDRADVIVVGMGPGGEAVAGDLARAGRSVIGVEAGLVGGECPYYGCIPSKIMIRAGNALAEARRVDGLAGTAQVRADFGPVARRIRDEATTGWDDRIAAERFENAGGRLVRGFGRVTGPRTVQVGDRELTADQAIVLNTGTSPAVPPIPGLADTPFWTNRDIVKIDEAPESLIVLGGGTIGSELAAALHRFGTTVDVVERADRLLPADEPEASTLLAEVFERDGIGVHTGEGASRVAHADGRFAVTVGDRQLSAARLLVATGRHLDLDSLGLASVGIDVSRPTVDPDEYLRIADGVYAIGDMTGKGAFTHMSMYQAGIVTRHLLGDEPLPAEYHAVPRVTFTDPEIGAVGSTEAQARASGLRVGVGRTQLPASTRGWIHQVGNDGFVKLVTDLDRGVLVGGTTAGPAGGEMLGLLTLAVHEAVPVAHLRRLIYAYPTFHRAIEPALQDIAEV